MGNSRFSSLIGRVKRWGAASAENSTLAQPTDWLLEALAGNLQTASGVTVNPLSALGVATVYACVNAVSRSISSLPLKLYRRVPDGGKQVASDHPLYALLHDAPNPDMTSAKFRRTMQANATLRNNGYALIVRNGLNEVVELWPIQNKDIKPEVNAAGRVQYKLGEKVLRSDQVLHISGLTLDGVQGLDLISTAREAIGLAIGLQDHGSRFFANASTPSVGIEIPTNLTPQQLKDFAEKWDIANTGKNKHKRSILFGGAKFAAVPQPNNEQSQFVAAKIYQDKCIAQAFGVPQIKAGITDAAHFNNVEQENLNYAKDTLASWCKEWEQALNQKLLTEEERKNLFFEFSLDGLLRGDAAARAAFYQSAIQNGWMTRNEARELENLNPAAGLDQFVMSQNVQLLDVDGNPIVPDPTPAPVVPAKPDPTPVNVVVTMPPLPVTKGITVNRNAHGEVESIEKVIA